MTGRNLDFWHPFFDMDPEEYWFRRYAGLPSEFWGSGFRPRRIPGRLQSRRGPSMSQLMEQHFGGDPLTSGNEDQSAVMAVIYPHSFYVRKPTSDGTSDRQTSGTSELAVDDKTLKIALDVQQFAPDELDVQVIDGEVHIHGKHEKKLDEHGFVSREFTRRYRLPDDVDPDTVKSSLSQEGILSIEAPRKLEKAIEGKKIPIDVQGKTPVKSPDSAVEPEDAAANSAGPSDTSD